MTYTFPLAPSFPTVALRRELERLFDEAVPVRGREAAWTPAVNIREDAAGFTVEMDLPGVAPEAVEVIAEDGTLTVRGTREPRTPSAQDKAIVTERTTGRFARHFRLPKTADQQAVTASYALGVLTVHIAKHAPAQPRRVPIAVETPAVATS